MLDIRLVELRLRVPSVRRLRPLLLRGDLLGLGFRGFLHRVLGCRV